MKTGLNISTAPAWSGSVDSTAELWSQFAEVADGYPGAVAVRDGDRSATYRNLADATLLHAAELVAVGVSAGDHVVVAVPRSLEEIVAVLAILRLGAAYVAIDPTTPEDRLAAILRRVRPRAVVGDFNEARRIVRHAPAPCPAINVSAIPGHATVVDALAHHEIDTERAAYVAHTSGSTGGPKAVRIPHRAVTRLIRGADYLLRGPGEVYLRLAPLAFDASTLEVFGALLTGATLDVFPAGPVAPVALGQFLEERNITVAWLTAGLFRIMVDDVPGRFSRLRQVLTGGDVVPAAHVRRLLAEHRHLVVTNGYGPTENTTFSTTYSMTASTVIGTSVPIGRPVAGSGAVVVTDNGQRTDAGEIGELYVTGVGLALDYLDEPTLTAAAFVPLPGTGERSYRTGDLAAWDAEGCLHFHGRRDRQVKIRGHRVELGEIEAALRDHPAVRDAAVTVRGADAATRHLLAVVVPTGAGDPVAELRAWARTSLPAHLVPTTWATVDRLPLDANGKLSVGEIAGVRRISPEVSRAQLASGRREGDPEVPIPGVRQEIEQIIVGAWRSVLETDDIELDEGFFDAGGDSISAARVHSLLCAALPDHDIRIVDLFRYPTIGGLAAHLVPEGTR